MGYFCYIAGISPADLDREAGFDFTKYEDDVDLDEIGFSVDEAIDRDIEALKKCSYVYMLRGWNGSVGARAEFALAQWMNLQIHYQPGAYQDGVKTEDVLEEALRITKGDRNAQYGPPDQDFRRTAAMWSALKGVEFEPREVALFMVCLKLSREIHQRKRDNWVDIAGYARCGSLCSGS